MDLRNGVRVRGLRISYRFLTQPCTGTASGKEGACRAKEGSPAARIPALGQSTGSLPKAVPVQPRVADLRLAQWHYPMTITDSRTGTASGKGRGVQRLRGDTPLTHCGQSWAYCYLHTFSRDCRPAGDIWAQGTATNSLCWSPRTSAQQRPERV